MPFTALPTKADLNVTPITGTYKAAIGAVWEYLNGLFGAAGTPAAAFDAMKLLDPQAIYNLGLAPTVGANALTMTLKSRDAATSLSAANPGFLSQRSATPGSGLFNQRQLSADVAVTISSGSTLGHLSGVAGSIYWYLIDNAGAQELALSATDFGASGIVSTTAEGGAGAADSATTMYSATARANVPYRFIGRSTDTQAAAGTWTAVPSLVELAPFSPVPSSLLGGANGALLMRDSTQLGGYRYVPGLNGTGYGLLLSNNGTDTVNDINIDSGGAMDWTGAYWMTLAASMGKQLDVAWVPGGTPGAPAGGRMSAAAIANTTYHMWLIGRSDTGAVDVGFDVSATAPTMPANYDFKVRIGSIVRESAAIVLFLQFGDKFLRKTNVAEITSTNPGAAAVTRTLLVPTGIIIDALVHIGLVNGAGAIPSAYLSCLAAADEAPQVTIAQCILYAISASAVGSAAVRTNTAAQIRSRLSASDASVTIYLNSIGWIDTRWKDRQ